MSLAEEMWDRQLDDNNLTAYLMSSDYWELKGRLNMDLYAKNKTEELYFKGNIYWWKELWEFVCLHCDFMSKEQKEAGFYNDGIEIDSNTSFKIGKKLNELLQNGIVEQWEKTEEKRAKRIQGCDWYETTISDRDWLDNYPYRKVYVENFAKFCLKSNGFLIW